MQSQQQDDRLSWGDAVFLHLEREGMPLNVAGVCIFEGEIKFADFRRVHRVEAAADSPLSQACSAPAPSILAFRVGNTIPIRHSQSRSRGDAEAWDRRRTEDDCWENSEHSNGPAAAAVGLDPGAWAERRSHRTHRSDCITVWRMASLALAIMNVLMDASPTPPALCPRRKRRLRVPPPRDAVTSLTGRTASIPIPTSSNEFSSALAEYSSMAERASPRMAEARPRTSSHICFRNSLRPPSACAST